MTRRVFTVAQQKGGAGKTTLVAHLAVLWSTQGQRVAVIDIDPQASLTRWVEMRRAARDGQELGFHFSSLAGWRLAAEVDRLVRDHDAVLIDSPPHAETEAAIAVRAASLVVIPVQPSPMDLWATRPTLELVIRERRTALLVINRMPSRARLAGDVATKLASLGVQMAAATIGNRIAFAESLADGKGISEAEPGSVAAQEIAAVAAEAWQRASEAVLR